VIYKVIPYFNLGSTSTLPTYRTIHRCFARIARSDDEICPPRDDQYAREDADRKKRNRFTALISRAPARPVGDVADTERQNDVSYDPLKSRAVTGCAATRSPLPGEEAPSKRNKGVVSRKWKSGGTPAGRT